MDEPAIATDGLTKRYGDLVAVDHLDLTVGAGEVFGLLGPNGAGKTTTILMLLGLTEPTEGQARVFGLDPTRHALEVKRRVGYLPDNVGFYPDLTARQNLRYIARLNRLSAEVAEERVERLLGEVGLTERGDDRVGTYSRGMRQRLGVADALVKDPGVLILDEPTVGIDPDGVREMLALIRGLAERRGATVLLSSHLLQQVQSVCDRLGIFVRGRLVAAGSLEELALGGVAQVVTEVEVEGSHRLDAVLRDVPGVLDVGCEGGRWVVTTDRDRRLELARALLEEGLVVVHLRLRSEELDEIYRRYFAGER